MAVPTTRQSGARSTSSVWRERVKARVVLLRVDLNLLAPAQPHETRHHEPPHIDATARNNIESLLDGAEQAIDQAIKRGWPTRVAAWWTGWAIEKAWRDIHDAEILMAEWRTLDDLDGSRPGIKSLAAVALPKGDAERAALEAALDDKKWPPSTDHVAQARAQYAAGLRSVYEASDEQYSRLRSFRNIILMTALLLLVLAGALTGLSIWKPSALPVCFDAPAATPTTETSPTTTTTPEPTGTAATTATAKPASVCPTGTKAEASYLDVPLVELLGILGVALAAAFALRTIRGTSTPYGVPVALALLKVPAGALTAFIGLLFLRAGFVPGFSNLDSQNQILAYAIVFGAAQQLITRLVDRQGQSLLDATTPSDKPAETDSGEAT